MRADGFAADDVLVFEQTDAGFALVGGIGRGAGWAGIVEVGLDEPSLVARAWRSGTPVRHASTRPRQIAGPYHARHAIVVPVGHRFVVVVGSARPISVSDSEAVRLAAAAIDATRGVPADKLLADELELVQAVRSLMSFRAETVRDTLRHVATVAASALSCDVAVISVEHEEHALIEGVDLLPQGARRESPDHELPLVAPLSLVVEQASPAGRRLLGIELASQMAVPIGANPALGSLVLGHAVDRPRGFTSLCQRIALAVADAAELLVTQAIARERLASERDLLARMSGTDALTGLANLRAWDSEAARVKSSDGFEGYVLSCDLDGLKAANDKYGHAAGDALLRATASVLSSTVRDSDLVARVGGDEFLVLLRGSDSSGARRILARIRRAEAVWRITEYALTPRLSIGLAAVTDNDVDAARQNADKRMYANKRRRARARQLDLITERRRGAAIA